MSADEDEVRRCKRGHDQDEHGRELAATGRRYCQRCDTLAHRTPGREYTEGYRWIWKEGYGGVSEYRLMRERGLSPREIADKLNVRWDSFQRTLYRRVGGMASW